MSGMRLTSSSNGLVKLSLVLQKFAKQAPFLQAAVLGVMSKRRVRASSRNNN